jgi:hypothetical protein
MQPHISGNQEGNRAGCWEDIERITETVNLSVSEILEIQALAMKPKKTYKRYYIPKNPFPRILKKDFRRDFTSMHQNVINSADSSLISDFFKTFTIPDFQYVIHNPILALGGLQPTQRKQGYDVIVPALIHRVQSFAEMVMLTENAQIIQREGEIGSKIIANTSVKATQIIIPNPHSVMKLDSFFCTCHFLDRQKLKILKTITELRAKYIYNTFAAASPIAATVNQILAAVRESFSFPAWLQQRSESVEESPVESEKMTTATSTTTGNEEIKSSASIASPQERNGTLAFMDVDILIQQMQLFYESFRKDVNDSSKIIQPKNEVNLIENIADSSTSQSISDNLIDHKYTKPEEALEELKPNKKRKPTTQGSIDGDAFSPSSLSTTSSSTPLPKLSSTEHHNECENTQQPSPTTITRPRPQATHFLNFQQEPVFVVCEVCGRNKFPNTSTLQALAKPFVLRCAVHPIFTFSFNEQNHLFKVEVVIPVEQNSYAMDLPAVYT